MFFQFVTCANTKIHKKMDRIFLINLSAFILLFFFQRNKRFIHVQRNFSVLYNTSDENMIIIIKISSISQITIRYSKIRQACVIIINLIHSYSIKIIILRLNLWFHCQKSYLETIFCFGKHFLCNKNYLNCLWWNICQRFI